MSGVGATPGSSMTGHLRLCFAAFVLLAGLSTSPASSNPFTASFNATPAEDTARTSAEEECLPRPGKSTADGQHWVYRLEGHRKCWFQAAGTATVKKPVQHHAAKHRVATPEENKTAARKPKPPVDALAELLLRSAPPETSQPTTPTPAFEVVDAGPVLATRTAPLLPPPVPNDQFMPDHRTPPQLDIETLLATAPAASDVVVASAPSTMPVALPATEAGDDGRGWTWLGGLLMALGLVSVVSSSRTIRGAVLLLQLR